MAQEQIQKFLDLEGLKLLIEKINNKADKFTVGTGLTLEDGQLKLSNTFNTDIFKVVTTLPTEDVDKNSIYVVPSEVTEDGNLFNEYFYVEVDGEYKWEKFGEVKASLSLDEYDKAIEALQAKVTALEEGKQDKGNYLEYALEGERKVVTLNNTDIFGARPNHGELADKYEIPSNIDWISLIQLNKWNVVDLGSDKTMLNINTPKDVRPTIQEKGQSGPQAHKMAYLSDVESVLNSIKPISIDEINDEFNKSATTPNA